MKFNAKLFWETQLTTSYDLQGVGYTSLGVSYNKWMYKVRKYVVGRRLRKLPIQWQKSCVLDIGFGTGFYINMYHNLNVKGITGFDITAKDRLPQILWRLQAGQFLVLQGHRW